MLEKTPYSIPISYLTALLLVVTVMGCAQPKDADKDQVKSAFFVVNYPMPTRDNSAYTLRDTFQIYFYGDYVLYALPHKSIVQHGDSVVSAVSDHLYYLYKKSAKFGFEFHSLTDTSRKQRSEKMIYTNRYAFAGIKLPTDHSEYDSLAVSHRNKTGDSIMEQYIVKKSQKGQYFDTSYYSYTKQMDSIPYSLSYGLDSLQGMKLYKVQFIFAPMFSKKDNMSFPLRTFFYELIQPKKDAVFEKSIITFIDKLKGALSFD